MEETAQSQTIISIDLFNFLDRTLEKELSKMKMMINGK